VLALAGCGGSAYSEVAVQNDLDRRVRLGYCADGDATCRQVRWWIAIDPGQRATEEIPSAGDTTRRFVVVAPPETIFGCFAFRYGERRPPRTVQLADAHGCGSGR
jgi:hypothetical protein